MTLVGLYSLFNISEDILGNFLKLFAPLIILLIIFLMIKWIQTLNRASSSDIVVLRRP